MIDEVSRLRGIAKGLDGLGVKPPRADQTRSIQWNPASIRHILTSPNYIGEGVQFADKAIDHPDPRFKKK